MRGWGAAFAIWAGLAWPAFAQTDPVLEARRAAQQIDMAGMALQDAKGAQDRVAALTQTVRAYESGLVALREGLRRAAIRQQAIQLELDARHEEVAQLLAVLVTMEQSPETLLLLHPSGPVGTARSAMVLGEITPALQTRAEALRSQLEEIALLRNLQENAAQTLSEGLQGVQSARTELSQAISDRRDLPRRFVSDPDKLLQLLESSDTLEAFASGLTGLKADGSLPAVSAGFDQPNGTLPLPVQGVVLRKFGETDAAGVKRPGLVLATAPQALVTTPDAATIRYLGPLLDYGNVAILEPAGDTLLILAGMAQVFGEAGQVLAPGAPVGLMGGTDPKVTAIAANAAKGGGSARTETLYIELRKANTPVDPAPWFRVRKE